MEKVASSTDIHVSIIERVVVAPCLPSPKTVLPLSPFDNMTTMFSNLLLVYNASNHLSPHPAKTIRQALSKILVYYYPLAGRLRDKENGDRELDCKGQGALFLEAMADIDLSSLPDLDHYNPSFHHFLFDLPHHTHIHDLHLLTIQVTRFTCGSFIVGTNVHNSICDGHGFSNFLKGMAEMAKGEAKPSIEPVWNREFVKHEDYIRLQMFHFESILPPLNFEKIVQTYLVINFEKISYIKQCIMKECKEFFSTFEILTSLVWLARTKAFRIPHIENVNLFFPMDMRKSFNPPLPEGYYGTALGIACAMDNVQDLLTGCLLRALTIIKKAKLSLNENFKSRIAMTQPSALHANIKHENIVSISDWRQSGFYEVDFGWGNVLNVSSLMQQFFNELSLPTSFIFLQPSKNMRNGIKILMFMPPSKVEPFKIEMEDMISKFVTKVCSSKL